MDSMVMDFSVYGQTFLMSSRGVFYLGVFQSS